MLLIRQLVFRTCCCLLVCVMVGCGPSGPKRDYAAVTGTVTYKGKPLEMGTVYFQPDVGPFVSGEIQPDGSYALRGVVGENIVLIVSRDPVDSTGDGDPGKPKTVVLPKSRIPEAYGLPTGKLKFEVQPGENTADFDLK